MVAKLAKSLLLSNIGDLVMIPGGAHLISHLRTTLGHFFFFLEKMNNIFKHKPTKIITTLTNQKNYQNIQHPY